MAPRGAAGWVCNILCYADPRLRLRQWQALSCPYRERLLSLIILIKLGESLPKFRELNEGKERAYTKPSTHRQGDQTKASQKENLKIMSFIGEILSEVVGNHERRDEEPMDPPYVQPPWVSRWDGDAGRWIFINEATGERSWERPVLEEAGE